MEKMMSLMFEEEADGGRCENKLVGPGLLCQGEFGRMTVFIVVKIKFEDYTELYIEISQSVLLNIIISDRLVSGMSTKHFMGQDREPPVILGGMHVLNQPLLNLVRSSLFFSFAPAVPLLLTKC